MVRLALFSVLGESIEGKRVLDLFAGSGVIGLEAISRGAAESVWVESHARTHETLLENVRDICGNTIDASSCIRADAVTWLKSSMAPKLFDLIVADPPYTKDGEAPWAITLLDKLTESEKLKPEGLFVLEQRVDDPVIDNPRWNILKEGCYGETRLVYYRRAKEKTS